MVFWVILLTPGYSKPDNNNILIFMEDSFFNFFLPILSYLQGYSQPDFITLLAPY